MGFFEVEITMKTVAVYAVVFRRVARFDRCEDASGRCDVPVGLALPHHSALTDVRAFVAAY